MKSKKLLTLAVALGLGLGLAQVSLAAETVRHGKGTITAVDAKNHTINIQERKAKLNFVVGKDTKILHNGKTLSLSELKNGQSVEISYASDAHGQHQAKEVKVMTRTHMAGAPSPAK